jgi:integrase
MRISENILIGHNGYFYFTYTYPRWLRQLDTSLPVSFRMSLKTKDLSVAEFKVKIFILVIKNTLIKIRDDYMRRGHSDLSIHQLLEKYRDYVEWSDDEYLQKRLYWGKPEFEEIMEHIEKQFYLLKGWDLFEHLDIEEFSNLDQLYDQAVDADKEKQEVDIKKKIRSRVDGVPAIKEVSVGVEELIKKISVSDLFEKFAENRKGRNKWSSPTERAWRKRVATLIESIGDKSVQDINRTDARIFHKYISEMTINSQGAEKELSAATKNDYLQTATALMNFGQQFYDGVENNFFEGEAFKFSDAKQDEKKRIPWSHQELITMFSAPIYKSTAKKILHPYYYWIPILGMCTGARLNELCSLHVQDIRKQDNFHYISINLDQPEKSNKTASERDIPIHQCLINLGFLEMIELMKDPTYSFIDENGYNRVWRGTNFNRDKVSYNKNPSLFFNRSLKNEDGALNLSSPQLGFKYQHGFDFPLKQKKDFHSFRHAFATIAGQQNMKDSTRFQITGHMSGDPDTTVGSKYDHGKTRAMLNEAIQKLDFEQFLKSVKPFFEIYPENVLRGRVSGSRK